MEGHQVFNEPLPNSQEPGHSHIYRQKGLKELITNSTPNIRTVRDIIEHCKNKHGDQPGLGEIIVKTAKNQKGEDIQIRHVQEYTYRQIYDQAYRLGKAIYDRKLGFKEAEKGMNLIGIYSKNRLEWYVTDWACALFGFTVSPLYDTLGKENLEYCIALNGTSTLFVSSKTASAICEFQQKGSLKTLVCFDQIDEELKKKLESQGLEVLGYWELIGEGHKSQTTNEHIKVNPEDIYTFCYTSGTTGPPKGALISHSNMMASTGGFVLHKDLKFNGEDTYLSTLPLPHLMERAISMSMFYNGAYVVVGSGNMLKIKEDTAAIKSTIFVSVPRLYNRIADTLRGTIDSMVKGDEQKRPHIEQAVFQKFRQGFGGKIKVMVTGSAPIHPNVQEYMQRAMGCPFIEGYGQTESPTALLVGRYTKTDFGIMQEICTGVELRLEDINEMKYTAADKDSEGRSTPRGQICARGPQIFQGYYKRPQLTNEAIIDGWLHTGDVGEITPSLGFKIIDRRKNIFKLQQGEYIAPDKVERVYLKSGLIEEMFLHGDSKNSFAVAIIVPKRDKVVQIASQLGIEGSVEQVLNQVELRRAYLKELNVIARASDLSGFMLAKNVYFDLGGFAPKGMLTNTMKLIRYVGREVYKKQIDLMYEEGEFKL